MYNSPLWGGVGVVVWECRAAQQFGSSSLQSPVKKYKMTSLSLYDAGCSYCTLPCLVMMSRGICPRALGDCRHYHRKVSMEDGEVGV